jgi:spermidine synthase
MILGQRDTEFSIRVNGDVLMNSRARHSEEQLAVLGCAHLPRTSSACVLIGGLGMGFTLRAALDVLPEDAQVDVAELVPEVVTWNRGPLASLAGAPLQDRRVHVHERDVLAMLQAAESRYHAVLLDVDNGPAAMTSSNNRALYSVQGLEAIAAAMTPNGVLALWSVGDDRAFTRRLHDTGYRVTQKRVAAGNASQRNRPHMLWLATREP